MLSLSPEWCSTSVRANSPSKLTKLGWDHLGISHNDRRVPAAVLCKSVLEKVRDAQNPIRLGTGRQPASTTFFGQQRVREFLSRNLIRKNRPSHPITPHRLGRGARPGS